MYLSLKYLLKWRNNFFVVYGALFYIYKDERILKSNNLQTGFKKFQSLKYLLPKYYYIYEQKN